MSRRTSIVKALAEKLKIIDGSGSFKTNLYGESHAKLRFWDEVSNFPSVYVIAGSENREYLPGDFAWGFLGIAIKVYTKGEDSQQLLENLLEDIESVLDANRVLIYDIEKMYETTDSSIMSINTDEGLLSPYSVGEINIQVRYAVM